MSGAGHFNLIEAPDIFNLQQPPWLRDHPLPLEEGAAVPGDTEVDDDVEVGLGGPDTAFPDNLDRAVLTPESQLVRAHNGRLRGVVIGGRTEKLALLEHCAQILVKNGRASRSEHDGGYVPELIVEDLLQRFHSV